MKKATILVFIFIATIFLYSCGTIEEYQIPEIIGKNLSDAKLIIAGEVSTKVKYVYSNEYLPETVLSFLDGKSEGDKMKVDETLGILVSKAPEGSYSYSNKIDYVYEIGDVTGPNSPNFEMLKEAGIGGTDLGIPVAVNDKMVFLFGDSFGDVGSQTGFWNSNFIAESKDNDLSDGIQFNNIITNDRGIALPFSQGLHQRNISDEASDNPDREVTKIPTGGITIGDDVYIFYMSVRVWNPGADWGINYNTVVKTDVNFTSFVEIESLKWNESEAFNFGQIYPFENPKDKENLYFISIPGGRAGGVALFRVGVNHFEDFEKYEYYLGDDNWVKGEEGLAQFKESPNYIISPPCSELSIMYNEYLGKWMTVYLRGDKIILQTANELTGEWSNPETIVTASDYNGLYGGFIHPNYVDFNGKKFYIQLSRWLPIYQTQLFEVVLK